jgi:hypothetical protein
MESWRFQIPIVFVMAIGIAAAASTEEVRKVEEKTFKLSSGGSVTLMADEGSVVVKAWDKEEVHLKMTKRAWGRTRREAERLLDEIEVQIQESRDKLVIREVDRWRKDHFNFFDLFDGEFWTEKRWRSGVVDFELMVPKQVYLRLQSDEGDVDVSGTEGSLTINADEGNVTVDDVVSDQMQLTVDEGDVRVSGLNGTGKGLCKIDADEGSIFMEDCGIEEMDLSADEGKIVLRDARATRIWLSADEGDIEADILTVDGGNYRMEADEGDIEVSIPAGANLRVKLQANEGRVDSDFDLSVVRTDDGETREGVIGRQEGMLRVLTEEGDILLIKRR